MTPFSFNHIQWFFTSKRYKKKVIDDALEIIHTYYKYGLINDVIFCKSFLTIKNIPETKDGYKYKVYIRGTSLKFGSIYSIEDWLKQLKSII